MLEDQKLSFRRLEHDLIGVVSFDRPGYRLASRDKADNDLLAFELGDKLWWALFCCCLLLFVHSVSSPPEHLLG